VTEQDHYLIIGLGNPGSAYDKTRHNVGFNIVKAYANKWGLGFKAVSSLNGELAQGRIKERKVLLFLPTTFMNLSGEAVRRCVDYYRVKLDQLIVVTDDVALPLASLRIRSMGSSGGHNGLKSIEEHLGTQHYARLRVGVGQPIQEELSDFVLAPFTLEESGKIGAAQLEALKVLDVWVDEGIAKAMQLANQKILKEKPVGE
jgi:PTH1 family peptidyl-tRNA hydrolase